MNNNKILLKERMKNSLKMILFLSVLILNFFISTSLFSLEIINSNSLNNETMLGEGTKENPYRITNWYELNNVRNYKGSHFILENNLDYKTDGYKEIAGKNANDGKGWLPIGDINFAVFEIDDDISEEELEEIVKKEFFVGVFNGNNKYIKGLNINREDDEDSLVIGLFGAVIYSEIKNLNLIEIDIKGNYSVGGLVGLLFESSLKNSYSKGKVKGLEFIGGLVGGVDESVITSSYSDCNVEGIKFVGGLVGKIQNNSTIEKSYSTGNIEGMEFVGGFAGGNFENSSISNSYSTGNVESYRFAGGFVGVNAEKSTISNSYSVGNVECNQIFGGFVGGNYSYSTIKKCYYDKEKSKQNDFSAIPKTSFRMKQQTTYENWDFEKVWIINEGISYPKLQKSKY